MARVPCPGLQADERSGNNAYRAPVPKCQVLSILVRVGAQDPIGLLLSVFFQRGDCSEYRSSHS